MADYDYELVVVHQDAEGNELSSHIMNGPHGFALMNMAMMQSGVLEHLEPNSGDPNAVRLKLTLRDNP